MSVDRVLILGAGSAGLRAALALDRWLIGHRRHEILLVDHHDYHQILPRLPAVTAGFRQPQQAIFPLRRALAGRKIAFRQATITSLDPAQRVVRTDAGDLGYGWLIVALGREAAVPPSAELARRTLGCWSIDDARRIPDAIQESFRRAAWKIDAAERDALATAIVVGAGRAGVEIAAALADRVLALAAHYRLPVGVGRVVLIEQAERVLPRQSRALSSAVEAALRHRGVTLRLGCRVEDADEAGVVLAGGPTGAPPSGPSERLPGNSIVWAAGSRPTEAIHQSGLAVDHSGRLVVDSWLRLPGHANAYAIGGAAVAPLAQVSQIAPMPGESGDGGQPDQSARAAVWQADVAARNIAAEILAAEPAQTAGSPAERLLPREYHAPSADIIVSLGRHDAVASIGGIVLGGWRAQAARRLAEARYLEEVGGIGGVIATLTG